MDKMGETETSNFQLFRDCLSTPLIDKSSIVAEKKKKKKKKSRAKAGRKTAIKPVHPQSEKDEERNDAAELAEFIDYLATEVFLNLPVDLRSLSYTTWLNTPALQSVYTAEPEAERIEKLLAILPGEIADTMQTYSLLSPHQTPTEFLTPIMVSYITAVLTPPPNPRATKAKATECEICGRSWIPLTYHHLIPKEAHARALKRGWHAEDQLNNVAWVCRACHSYVHSIASNEELARDWHTVDILLEREDIRKFAAWVSGVRWKKT